jgi:choline-sulfatase
VLLLTIDTTVPEALGAYGGPAGLTPNLDRLAAEGVVFEDARAVTPLTLPSHASILTGLVPPRHSVRRNGETRLPFRARTLAEYAREAGLRTAAFVAAVVLAPEFGLDQGFERYDAPATPDSVEAHLAASRTADEIAERGLAWLDERDADESFLLWLHFYDPHFPYRPPEAFLERAGGDAYLGEVAAMDAAIGRVLDRLAQDGRLDSTLVLVVADHGEGRGRHGEDTHGAFVFDSTIRIPLLARFPGGAHAGERLAQPVSQVDLVPLALGVLGLPLDPELDGRDPFSTGAADDERGAYFESYFGTRSFGWSHAAGWADGHGKYVHSSAPEFYDLVQDPGETRNLLEERPGEVEAARTRITELCDRPRLAVEVPGDELTSLQRQIEHLGYAGVGSEGDEDPEPLAAARRPSPHAMVAAYADYMEGRKIHEEGGPPAEASARLERAVAANPENHKAWFTLGLVEQGRGRFERAVQCFERVLPHPGGERIPAQLNLAVCLYNLGRRPEAIAHLQDALTDTIGPPGALDLLVRMLEEEGRSADAARQRARAR